MDGQSLHLSLGPLRYLLVAHDTWAEDMLARLQKNMDCLGFAADQTRIVHMLEFEPAPDEQTYLAAGALPPRLAALLPDGLPPTDWSRSGDDTGHLCWTHPAIARAIWMHGGETPHYPAVFQLPWLALLHDIVALGGGIIHSGLVLRSGKGYLISAPQGGGKTTTLSRLPPPWTVLADDAALIWPTPDGFWASPLPTRGVVIRSEDQMARITHWQVGKAIGVAGLVMINKANVTRLDRVQPIAMAPAIYRALSEHPAVVYNRNSLRMSLFHTACRLAVACPGWQLHLSLHGPFAHLLDEAIADG